MFHRPGSPLTNSAWQVREAHPLGRKAHASGVTKRRAHFSNIGRPFEVEGQSNMCARSPPRRTQLFRTGRPPRGLPVLAPSRQLDPSRRTCANSQRAVGHTQTYVSLPGIPEVRVRLPRGALEAMVSTAMLRFAHRRWLRREAEFAFLRCWGGVRGSQACRCAVPRRLSQPMQVLVPWLF